MARPPVVVVCTNVAQAGEIARGISTKHRHEGAVHPHHEGHHGDTRRVPAPRSGPASSAPRAHRATAVRLWKVFDGKTLHEVRDLGTRLEARSEDGGAPVWTGMRLPSGAYETLSTTIPAPELASFLEKVHDGDETTSQGRQAPASGPRASARTPRAASVRAPGTKRRRRARQLPAAPHAEAPKSAHAPPKKRGRPKKVKAPASTAPKSARPKSTQPKSRASASAPKSAQRRPAAKEAAPPTSRSPGSNAVTPASIRRRLQAMEPGTTADVLDMMEDIWRGGGSLHAQAWMAAKGFTDLATAFADWVDHHHAEAAAYREAGRTGRSRRS